jgi:pimeloyl-ACP methyl ester carboxylesterase
MEHDYTGKNFFGPTLFIGGSKAAYVKPEFNDQIRSIFPKAKIEMVDCGHYVHAEKPEEFVNIVQRFLLM